MPHAKNLTFLLILGITAVFFIFPKADRTQDSIDSEESRSERVDAAIGVIEISGGAAVEPGQKSWLSPSGRLIRDGDIHEKGYVLPRDIKRPRLRTAIPERPTRQEILERRAQLRRGPQGPFPEIRLGPDDGRTQNETSIGAAGQTLIAGWNQFTDSSLTQGLGRSGDGGETWSWQLLDGHAVTSDPIVAHGGGDRWYFAYIANGPSGGDIDVYVRRSLDDGLTWQAPVDATGNNVFDDKPHMSAAGEEVLIAFADFGQSPAQIAATRSLDGGLSFSVQETLSQISTGGNGACTVIAPDGSYYVFWRGSSMESLWMVKSTDQGTTWSQDSPIADLNPIPSSLPPGFRIVNFPSAAAHPLNGTLVVVWNSDAFGDADILSTRSTDGGATWSAPIRVPQENGGASQFFPWITFDEAGTAWVLWYDQRGAGSEIGSARGGTAIDVYLASSTDAGLTWGPEIRVTSSAFQPILPHEPGAADFIGDYNGIAASGDRVYPFFQDAREGNQDVWVALVQTSLFTDDFESGDLSAWGASLP